MIKRDIEDLSFSNQTDSTDREFSLHQNTWTKREGMVYHKDFENHPSIIEQPICLLRTL